MFISMFWSWGIGKGGTGENAEGSILTLGIVTCSSCWSPDADIKWAYGCLYNVTGSVLGGVCGD